MTTFMNLWMSWAYYFNALPYGDHIAAILLVGLVIFILKRMKRMMRYV